MPSYVILGKFTDQGTKSIKDTTQRAKALRETAKPMGITVKDVYWTLGRYDVVLIAEGQEKDVAALLLKVASMGNLKMETLRAFTGAELDSFLTRV